MIMTRAIWWSDGDENLTGVRTRESGRKGMETIFIQTITAKFPVKGAEE